MALSCSVDTNLLVRESFERERKLEAEIAALGGAEKACADPALREKALSPSLAPSATAAYAASMALLSRTRAVIATPIWSGANSRKAKLHPRIQMEVAPQRMTLMVMS